MLDLVSIVNVRPLSKSLNILSAGQVPILIIADNSLRNIIPASSVQRKFELTNTKTRNGPAEQIHLNLTKRKELSSMLLLNSSVNNRIQIIIYISETDLPLH